MTQMNLSTKHRLMDTENWLVGGQGKEVLADISY